ncbi:Mce protein [Mycobacterium sp. 663a-19]|uniref:Mce protein n=1 Tax=Mycobacterium sp. 663a-19 TaxID=2986148 RepID=UPI002D1F4F5A|nr:Mce protein [Mycobacterium sp. 663a-19]MEB3983148.1 Mce protein [Mycobacterium sp. 663a-19]
MTTTADQEPATTQDVEDPPDGEAPPAAAPDPGHARRARRPWQRYARIAVVMVVFAGAFGTAAALGAKLWDEHAVSQAGRAAQQTAINYAQVLTSIDSGQLDQNFAAVLSGATGEFKDTYTKASGQLRQLLIDNKATAHGIVVDSAIQSETRDRVVVLLMVDQTVSNTARPDGRVDRSRMKMTMERVDGRWLASKVELP